MKTAVSAPFDPATLNNYAYLPGRAGGQTLYGGNAASNNLTLSATSSVTPGNVILCATGTTEIARVNQYGIGIGGGIIPTAAYPLYVSTAVGTGTRAAIYNTGGSGNAALELWATVGANFTVVSAGGATLYGCPPANQVLWGQNDLYFASNNANFYWTGDYTAYNKLLKLEQSQLTLTHYNAASGPIFYMICGTNLLQVVVYGSSNGTYPNLTTIKAAVNLQVGTSGAGYYAFVTTNNERMRILAGSNTLQGNTGLTLQGGAANGNALTLSATAGTVGAIYFCNTAATATMTLLSTGTLLINAAAAIGTEKLYVNGSVNISDTGNLTWAGALKNIRIGNSALANLTTGTYNVAIGESAMGVGVVTGADNIAIGQNALEDCTTGHRNVMIGYSAGLNLTTGAHNVAIGDLAMGVGVVDSATGYNVAIGVQALEDITTTTSTVAIGYQAGQQISTANGSTIIGHQAVGTGILTGNYNTVVGYTAFVNATSGAYNTVLGMNAWNTGVATGNGYNVVIGMRAADFATSMSNCIAIGQYAMGLGVVTGANNIAIGQKALEDATSAATCVAIGYQAGLNLTTATDCIAIGDLAMGSGIVTALDSIAVGRNSLNILTSGADNIGIGRSAGILVTTGTLNTYVGALAGSTGASAATLTKSAAFGYNALVSASNTMVLGGTGADAVAVCIGATAAVGTEILYAAGAIRGTGTAWLGCPAAAPADATLTASQVTWWVDEAGNLLTFKVKYAGGTVKSGTVALA